MKLHKIMAVPAVICASVYGSWQNHAKNVQTDEIYLWNHRLYEYRTPTVYWDQGKIKGFQIKYKNTKLQK